SLRPASGILVPWGTRWKILVPHCCSSALTRRDAAATARFSLSAAREILPSSAIARTSWTVVESIFIASCRGARLQAWPGHSPPLRRAHRSSAQLTSPWCRPVVQAELSRHLAWHRTGRCGAPERVRAGRMGPLRAILLEKGRRLVSRTVRCAAALPVARRLHPQ